MEGMDHSTPSQVLALPPGSQKYHYLPSSWDLVFPLRQGPPSTIGGYPRTLSCGSNKTQPAPPPTNLPSYLSISQKSLFLTLDISQRGWLWCWHLLLQMPPPPRSHPHLPQGKPNSPSFQDHLSRQLCEWHHNC